MRLNWGSSLYRRLFTLSLALFLVVIEPVIISAEELSITGNGAGSNNDINIQVASETEVAQENNVAVENTLEVEADTGSNEASDNLGGDTGIATGDITTSAVAENSANQSVASSECCQEEVNAAISKNAAGSDNSIEISQSSTTDIIVTQNADITNSVTLDANTGRNDANDNSGGDVEIITGDIKGQATMVNAPVNSSNIQVAAGSPGGSAKIIENGANSVNEINVDLDSDVNVFTSFSANLDNIVIWEANTGGNTANDNLGGSVTIKTGDIDLQTFIENFANMGVVDINCCKLEPGEYDPPGEEKEKEDNGEDGGGGGDGGDGDGNGDGGQILDEAAATEAGGPGIMDWQILLHPVQILTFSLWA